MTHFWFCGRIITETTDSKIIYATLENDKLEDLIKTPEGGAVLGQLMAKMMPAKEGEDNPLNNPENSGKMMQMLGSFTILRLIGLIGAMGVKPTKEELLALNAQLNNVKKPD